MNEDFLYYLWRFGKFDKEKLCTSNGESIEIIHPGYLNEDAGPDFFNAKIRIGEYVWAGNVEIHVKASDWIRHGHPSDSAYDNIILHVVHEEDVKIKRNDQSEIPTLQLLGMYSLHCWEQYLDLVQGFAKDVACESELGRIPILTKQQCTDRMLVERLEQRSSEIEAILLKTRVNWEESFYRILARSFGFRVNNLPFEVLASTLPLSIIGKHRDQLLQLEALYFGQAGLLTPRTADSYELLLQREFNHLKNKYALQPMQQHVWKFGRLRPANFPTLRIAQFAMLYYRHDRLFDNLLHASSLKEITALLSISASEYWNTHYSFSAKSQNHQKQLGTDSIESLVINTLAPFTFFYGEYHHSPPYKERAIAWLEECKPENHRITRMWEHNGWEVHSARAHKACFS